MQPLRAPVRIRQVSALLSILATLMAVVRPAAAQTTGQWTSLETWPYRAIFTTLLPNGKVYFYSYYSESLHPQIWDPATNTVSAAADSSYELFCSGLTGLADGRIFITGGHIADYVGYPHAIIYDPNKNSITQLPDMNAGRWYPTNTVLPNGDVLVVSGDMTSNTTPDPLPQVWQFSTNSWRNLTTAQLQMPLYPVMFVAPNGKVFNAGPSRTTRYLDTSGTGSWTTVATMNFGGTRDYGPGVMYDVGKVLEVGGSDPPTATAETIDLNATTPAWKSTSSMHYARRQHNAVVLPDGKVLVVGGSSGSGFDNSSTPVYPTEMWDPATGQWTVMASIATYRGYHSTAILLPDGRVLSAGGNVAGPTAQIFSPPYLFNGARPTISSAPGGVGYGQTVFVGTPDATSISQVSFIRLPATTHTFDMSTRFMRLTFTQASGGLNVTTPANANIAPPGYYMLFILNSAGVPSVAKIVQITPGGGNSTTGTVSGTVTNTSGAPLGGATISGGGASTQTLADGTYTLANVTPGSVTLTASLTGYASASESVSVTAGSTASAATLALAPTNPGSVTGTIVKNTGVGISGATVSAEGVSALTNSSGVYTLNNLPAGSVTLTASAPRYQTKSETVTVTAGTTTTAPTMTLISATGAVKGTVMSTAGTAISGALLSYGGGQTTSNSTGAYLLTGIPPGTIQLVASATGYASQTQNVNIVAGSTATANYTLSPSTTTTGTVTGKVTNISNGVALSGATVTWGSMTATTNSSGVYTLSNVTSGTQSFTAKATGYIPRTVSASVAGGATTTVNIPMATGGRINVTVKTSSGALVSGATVKATGGVISTTVTGTSNTSGVYLTPWIPIGSYNVTVSLSGFTTQTKTVSVTTGNTISVTFTGF